MTRPRHIAAIALSALVLAGAGLAGCGGSGLPDGVVAQVGGQDISRAELDQLVNQQKSAAEQQGQGFPEPGSDEYVALERQALEGLVFQRIVALEAKECGTPCVATAKQVAAERKKVIAD
ncbi:MAG: SurA N-terminal domain-containing protein, partial [Miltoncostaeaceae bacterium]